jgi:signal peptidase
MLEKINKLKENKILKTIYNIIYYIMFALVALLLIVVILQRTTNNNVSLGGFRVFNIVTPSMVPKYIVGDVLLSKEVPINDLKVGDDVVYLGEKSDFAGKYITHQIINIEINSDGTKSFHTKGIANDVEDPLVNQNQIKGIVVYKFLTLSFMSKIMTNLYSMYFVIFIPIAIIIFMNILKIISNKNEEDNDNSKEE